jgi:hypothetical protein
MTERLGGDVQLHCQSLSGGKKSLDLLLISRKRDDLHVSIVRETRIPLNGWWLVRTTGQRDRIDSGTPESGVCLARGGSPGDSQRHDPGLTARNRGLRLPLGYRILEHGVVHIDDIEPKL